MKSFVIILLIVSSGLFGQDNPMFDSLSYFERNKIKTVYAEANEWWYGHPFESWKISFDKNNKTILYHSIVLQDTSNQISKSMAAGQKNRSFSFRDTTYWARDGKTNIEFRYEFDNKKRLKKELVIDNRSSNTSHYGFRFSKKDTSFSSRELNRPKTHITSTTYHYVDTNSAQLKKRVTESPYFISETIYYYEKHLLSMKITSDSNKINYEPYLEVIMYDYYPDRKLKQETRRIADNNCPGVVGHTKCEGYIKYRYDTEFSNDSTPIPGIPYVPLLTINNRHKTEIYVELWGYDGKNDKPTRTRSFSRYLSPGGFYEIVFDPRPDKDGIFEKGRFSYFLFDKNRYIDLEARIYTVSNNSRHFESEKEKLLFQKKYAVESLFKKHKMIKIK